MADRLTALMEEAYAAAPADVGLIHMLSLHHATFEDGPIHVCMGVEADITVTLETGATVTMTADPASDSQNRVLAFDFTPPGYSDDGPTSARLGLDNVSGKLMPHLKAAVGAGTAIAVIYRAYREDDLSEPGEVIEGMRLKSVELSPTRAEGDLTFEDTSTQAFPRVTYGIDEYPALWNQ